MITAQQSKEDMLAGIAMKRLWNTQPATPGAEGAV